MIIDKDSYIGFLKNLNYPECKIKEIEKVKFESGLDGEYPKLDSNKQLKTIMQILKKINTLYYRVPSYSIKNRLVEILAKKDPFYESYTFLHKILDEEMDDLDFYKYIKKNLKKLKYSNKGKNILPVGFCDPRETFTQSVYYHLVDTYIKNIEINNYLDIGSGDGYKAYYLGKQFSLEKENIIGLDFTSYGSVDYLEKRNKNITFVNYVEKDNLKYPFKNNSFDLVSSFMVAHHIEDLDSFFKEINRIVKKDKYFLLADHNNVNMIDKMLTDIEHGMYETVYKKGDINLEYLKNEYTRYYDWVEWSIILEKYGFKLITKSDYSNNLASTLTSTLTFFALYKKL